MKEIILYWGIDADLILVPNFIAEQLIIYQRKFDKWINDISNKHGYWRKDGEGELALSFNAEVFVNWLNDFVILDENQRAKIIKSEFQPSKEDMKLPRINF